MGKPLSQASEGDRFDILVPPEVPPLAGLADAVRAITSPSAQHKQPSIKFLTTQRLNVKHLNI